MSVKGYFVPEGLKFEKKRTHIKNKFGEMSLEIPCGCKELAEKCIERVKLARERHLLHTPVRKIIRVLEKAFSNLSDRSYCLRKEAEQVLPVTTGLSPRMLCLGLDALTKVYDENSLLDMLYSELGDPEYLDGFRKSRAGESRAYGRELVVNVFGSGGVPGLQALGIVNGLLMKSAVFSKPDSSEPILPSIFSRALADVDPRIAEASALFPWKGGDLEFAGLESCVFSERKENEAIAVFGSEETIREVRRKASPECTFIAYPPRTSLIMVAKEKLAKKGATNLAERAAWDICMHDQKACFSPQYIYLEEGGEISPEEFAEVLSEEMDRIGEKYPVGELTDYAKTRINERKRTYELHEIIGSAKMFNPRGGLVIFDRNRALETPITYRTIHVMPVRSLSEALNLWKPFEKNIQTVGIEAGEEEFCKYSDILSQRGNISRITTPGKMFNFPPTIHHDGRKNFDGLLKWVDRIF